MEFDINTGRSIVTVLGLITFIGLMIWAFSSKNSAAFEEAANLPLEQD
jgi:cytochrome c oxidase cbb3-type subunit 4